MKWMVRCKRSTAVVYVNRWRYVAGTFFFNAPKIDHAKDVCCCSTEVQERTFESPHACESLNFMRKMQDTLACAIVNKDDLFQIGQKFHRADKS